MTTTKQSPLKRLKLAKKLFGWEPHPTQREWLLGRAPVKVAACGRRWGKTEACAVDVATFAVLNPGSRQMIVSPSYDQSRIIFNAVEKFLFNCPVTIGRTRVLRTPYPRLEIAGAEVTARTADEDGRGLRGHNADRVVVDEAAFVRDEVIDEVIAPMLADHNGLLVLVSTPFGKNHFYRSFVRGQGGDPRCKSFTYPSSSNPHVSSEYIEQQRAVLIPRQFAVEYEAAFVDDQCSVFAWEDVQSAVNRDLATARNAPVVAGIDWARYSDYTAIVAANVDGDAREVFAIDRFNQLTWGAQIDRAADFLAGHGVTLALCDQTSIGDPLLEQLQSEVRKRGMGVRIEGYTFTNQSKQELVSDLGIALSQGMVSLPGDDHLLEELRHFEYELTTAGSVRMQAVSGRHDDLVIALSLANRAAKELGQGGVYTVGGGRVAARSW